MHRFVRGLAGLFGLAAVASSVCLTGGPTSAASGPPALRAADQPGGLQVRITSITPSTLQSGTPVRVTGTVTNAGDVTWADAQVFVVMSATPMTTNTELDQALRTDPSALIGNRIVEPGEFAQLGDLPSGGVDTFSVRVPYGKLPIPATGASGVYWLGVQVLATPPSGVRDDVADARARSFIALMPTGRKPATISMALMWPVTYAVPELRAGVFANEQVGKGLAPGGRLAELMAMAQGAPPGRLNWLVDPAVVAAAEQMRDGYVVQGPQRKKVGAFAVAAQAWLTSLRTALTPNAGRRTGTTLALPYGDPDVTALVHAHLRGVLRPAQSASDQVMRASQLSSVAALWPADGLSDRRTLSAGQRAGTSLTLLSDGSLPPDERGRPVLSVPTRAGAVQTLLASSSLFGGGPRPGPTSSALPVRQRLLAETALLSLSQPHGRPARVVVTPPRNWNPGDGWADADFFAGLRVPWLRLAPLSELLAPPPHPYTGRFLYSGAARRAELPSRLLSATHSLRRVSTTLTSLLTAPAAQQLRYNRAIGTSASLHWRDTPSLGAGISTEQAAAVRSSLNSVDIQTSSFVTLSSSSGRFPVTVTNGLRSAIRVGLSVAPADTALGISPVRPVLVQSQQRTTITVTAKAERIGLTSVTVRPVTARGRPFGHAKVISVRATQYGRVGWIIVVLGVTVLFATSALRIGRRLLTRRAAASHS